MPDREMFTCDVVIINDDSKPEKITVSYYKTADYKSVIGFRAIITEAFDADGKTFIYTPALEVNIEREIYLHSQKETPVPKPVSTTRLEDVLPDEEDDQTSFDESTVVILDESSKVVEEKPKSFGSEDEGGPE